MGTPDQYVLSKNNYMPVANLKTISQGDSLIVMPINKLSELIGQVREKSKTMVDKPDISNQEKLVTELIRIDSDNSDSENNLMSNIEGS